MEAYIIVQANITDKEKYKEYLSKVTSIVKKYALDIIHQTLIKNKTINDIEVRMYRKPNI